MILMDAGVYDHEDMVFILTRQSGYVGREAEMNRTRVVADGSGFLIIAGDPIGHLRNMGMDI
jgi:hypothetical protein